MELVMKGMVAFDEALALSTSPEDFRIRYSGVSQDGREWNDTSEHQQRIKEALKDMDEIEVDFPTDVRPKKASGQD